MRCNAPRTNALDNMELKLALSNFEDYLEEKFLIGEENREDYLSNKILERNNILLDFPHSIILKLFYHQMDFADWLLWQILGARNGDCNQRESEVPACRIQGKHNHSGIWTSFWLAKTDYDYGFNEWLFKTNEDSHILIEILPLLEQIRYCGVCDDKYFWNFLDDLSDKTKCLSKDNKLKYFQKIDWKANAEELLNETYRFKNDNETYDGG